MYPVLVIVFTLVEIGKIQGKDGPFSDIYDRCLETSTHKILPGPEDDLYKQCAQWKERSCCDSNVTQKIHELNLHRFNYNHCPSKQRMSAKCKEYFVQDLCFFECSPHLGPWAQKVKMRVRKERVVGVPLCQSECEDWYYSCANDYTCTDNWSKNLYWTESGNKCLETAKCLTFRQIFRSPKHFCQEIWDGSWKVVNDSKPCMKLWFNSTQGNPNNLIYKLKVKELNEFHFGDSRSSEDGQATLITIVVAFIVVALT